MQPDITNEKKRQRKEIRQRIAAFDEIELEKSNRAIYNNLSTVSRLQQAERVFLYASAGREVSTAEIISDLYRKGKTILLPVSLENGEMFFAEYDPAAQREGRYKGILEPPKDARQVIPHEGDVMIVPALCFNHQGYRMGQGGGYYDRYLSRYRLYTIGLARKQLMPETLITEAHDMRVHCVVTEDEIIETGAPEGTPA